MIKSKVSLLNEFTGHKVELSMVDPLFCFMYQRFQWTVDDDYLILQDETEEEAIVYIPLDEITEIKNINDKDMYSDVVDIKTSTYTLSVCCMEARPVIPICDRCKKPLENEQVWFINQTGEYGSRFDSETINKRLCDDCLDEVFGIEDNINDISFQENISYLC